MLVAQTEQFVTDSVVEEDGFNWRAHREGKAYAEPLQASIAVSDLNL